MPIIDDQENLVNSDDEDEQGHMPVDDAQTECNKTRNFLYFSIHFVFF